MQNEEHHTRGEGADHHNHDTTTKPDPEEMYLKKDNTKQHDDFEKV